MDGSFMDPEPACWVGEHLPHGLRVYISSDVDSSSNRTFPDPLETKQILCLLQAWHFPPTMMQMQFDLLMAHLKILLVGNT